MSSPLVMEIKGVISALPEADKSVVWAAYYDMGVILHRNYNLGLLAIALLGAEQQEKADEAEEQSKIANQKSQIE